MGNSSVACSFSGIQMIGEPIVFLPLIPSPYPEKIIGSRMFSGSIDACSLMSPLTLPVYGFVDDYGRVRDVRKDLNAEILEEVFGPLDHFLDACVMGDDIKTNDLIRGSGCYFHPAIFDRIAKPLFGGSVWSAQFAGAKELELIGCQLIGKGFGRYENVYKIPFQPRIEFCTDGMFTQLYIDGEQIDDGYGLDDFQKSMIRAKLPGFDQDFIRKVKNTSELSIKLAEELSSIQSQIDLHRKMSDTIGNLIDESDFFDCFGSDYFTVLKGYKILFKHYLDRWAKHELLDEFEKLFNLLHNFCRANRLLMPSICGSQYPEHSETLAIADFIKRIAHSRAVESCREDYEN